MCCLLENEQDERWHFIFIFSLPLEATDIECFLASVASRGKEKMKVKWHYYECEGEYHGG